MMKRILQLSALYLCFTAVVCGTSLPPHDVMSVPNDRVRHVVLDNGMNILLYRQTYAPKVLVQIAYNIGSSVEKEGERGLAHLLEHMIFKGTDTLREGDIDAIARKYGASFNASTSYDRTTYFFEVNKNNWGHFVPILADCMQNARFNDQHLASEIKAVIQELRMGSDSVSRAMISHMFETLYPANHPYHHSVIGYKEDLAGMTSERLTSFYHTYYQPARATLFIVGDIDLDEAEARARASFASIPNRAAVTETPCVHVPHTFVVSQDVLYRDVAQESVLLYWRLPASTPEHDVLINAMSYLVGGSHESIVSKTLVDEKMIATQAGAFAYKSKEAGFFAVYADAKQGQVQACKEQLRQVVEKALRDGFSDTNLYKMVKVYQSDHLEKMYSLRRFADEWMATFFQSGNPYAVFTRINDLAQTTCADVQDFMRTHIKVDLANTLFVKPLPRQYHEMWKENKIAQEEYYAYLLEHHKRTEPLEEPTYVHTLPEPQPLTFTFPQPDCEQILPDNGLTLLTYTDKSVPLVNVNMILKDGAELSKRKEGAALSLALSMVLQGAAGMSREEILDFYLIRGATCAISSSGVSITCSQATADDVLHTTARLLLNPDFDEEIFENIRAQVVWDLEEKKTSPQAQADRLMHQTLYGKGHPYSWSFDEMLAYVKTLTCDDLRRVHKKYLVPQECVVSVVSSFSPEEMATLWQKVTAHWKHSPYEAVCAQPGVQDTELYKVLPLLKDQSFLVMSRLNTITRDHPDYVPLRLLNVIAFYSLGSRLYSLRERSGLFYGAGGAFASSVDDGNGYDRIAVLLNPENVKVVIRGIRGILADLAENGVTEKELRQAREVLLKSVIDLSAHPGSLVARFGSLYASKCGFDYFDDFQRKAEKVTLEDMHRVAKKYANLTNMAYIVTGAISSEATTPS